MDFYSTSLLLILILGFYLSFDFIQSSFLIFDFENLYNFHSGCHWPCSINSKKLSIAALLFLRENSLTPRLYCGGLAGFLITTVSMCAHRIYATPFLFHFFNILIFYFGVLLSLPSGIFCFPLWLARLCVLSTGPMELPLITKFRKWRAYLSLSLAGWLARSSSSRLAQKKNQRCRISSFYFSLFAFSFHSNQKKNVLSRSFLRRVALFHFSFWVEWWLPGSISICHFGRLSMRRTGRAYWNRVD